MLILLIPKIQKKNNINSNSSNETPSPLDYYSESMQSMIPNQQNDISSQQMWNDQSKGINNFGMGMFNPGMTGMGSLGGMGGIGMNSMNPLMGMNMMVNPYGNYNQFGNIKLYLF